jgi:hypothetical protein
MKGYRSISNAKRPKFRPDRIPGKGKSLFGNMSMRNGSQKADMRSKKNENKDNK